VYDYPWYNPVYPEEFNGSDNPNVNGGSPAQFITFQRGNIWVFGSIAQRRRGFMNRSGNPNDTNPDMNSYWDLGEYHHEGPVYWQGGTYVFGAAHYSTGYEKRYYFDNRFENDYPPDYPEVHVLMGSMKYTAYKDADWTFVNPPRNWDLSSY
jgi:hypothetical protein